MIDFGIGLGAGPPEEIVSRSIAAIKGRIDHALEGCSGEPGEVKHKVNAVSRLKNGGILLEWGGDEAAIWFADTSVRQKFLTGFHPEAVIKARDYHVVVQFVPLTFRPDREENLREIEEVNGMKNGAINRARWIKPVSRRSPSQTCGHAIFSLSSPQSANDVLANGLVIHQKKVYVEKCKREPLRCLKCHGWGHMARDCQATTDTCGTCAQRHRTDTCGNTARPHCVSCGVGGHAS